jgi:membrane-bound lytic murein transglycosylase
MKYIPAIILSALLAACDNQPPKPQGQEEKPVQQSAQPSGGGMLEHMATAAVAGAAAGSAGAVAHNVTNHAMQRMQVRRRAARIAQARRRR